MRAQRDAPCLEGPRVLLRPLRSQDFDAWHDVRRRSREWLETWEPLPEPGSPDPATDPDAFRARCGAWDRQRQFDAAYGFGVFLRAGERFAGPKFRRAVWQLHIDEQGVAGVRRQVAGD